MALARDFRYALRRLRNNPGFAAVAVISLALGIGANTAVFSVVDALFFKPIPVRDPARVVTLVRHMVDVHKDYGLQTGFEYPNYRKLRGGCGALIDIAAHYRMQIDLGTPAGTERTEGALVSGNYFDVLGVHAILGRTFAPEEDLTLGAYPVAVISGRLWERRFHSDLAIVGKTARLNGRDFTIIGVAPAGFNGTVATSAAEIWVPIMMWKGLAFQGWDWDVLRGGASFLELIGRLRPGVAVGAAQAALRRSQGIERFGSNSYPSTIALTPLGSARLPLEYAKSMPLLTGVLFGVAGLLLAIGCANVASLLVGRAAARQKEIAIRTALGASRGQIAAELMAESLSLGALGGGAGILIALWTLQALETWRPAAGMPLPANFGIDFRVLAFALAASVLSGAAVALMAGLRATKADPAAAMKAMPSGAGDRKALSLRNVLVGGQIALTVVLLAGAGLLLRTFLNVQSIPLGFNPRNVILLNADLTRHGFSDEAAKEAYPRLLERVRNLPGVEVAALATEVPLTSSESEWNYHPVYQGAAIQIDHNIVTPGYFRAMGISLLRGRDLTAQDAEGAVKVAVVNEAYESLLRQWQKTDNVVGWTDTTMGVKSTVLIVGVAKDNKDQSLRPRVEPRIFVPFAQHASSHLSLVIRTKVDPRPMLETVLSAARETDPALPASAVSLMSDKVGALLWQPRIASAMVSAFALIAALLAMVGVYGAVSFEVSRRAHEIGIRIALGAERRDVLRMVLARGALVGSAGAAAGVCAAIGMTRLIAVMLYGVSPTDPVVLAAVALMLVAVAALASLIPARRATAVDPIEALRYQ